jgi:hypothetical protein
MYIEESLASCGVCEAREWRYHDSAAEFIERLLEFEDSINIPFIVFSDFAKESSNGSKLAKDIQREKLGPVFITASRKNPHTRNTIKVFVWAPDWKKVQQFIKDAKIHQEYWQPKQACTCADCKIDEEVDEDWEKNRDDE